MELIVKKIEKKEVEKMEKSFSKEFLQSINQPYYSQKVFKFYTYKRFFNIEDENLLLKVDAEHYYEWQYVSTSYTWDYIFLAIADKKIGIDIETIKERSPEMIDFFSKEEYDFLWEKKQPLLPYIKALWYIGKSGPEKRVLTDSYGGKIMYSLD